MQSVYSTVADFSSTGAKAPTLAERASILPARRGIWFEREGNLSMAVSIDATLNDECSSFQLKYLILAVDLGGSFAQHLMKRLVDSSMGSPTYAASHGFWGLVCEKKSFFFPFLFSFSLLVPPVFTFLKF